MALHDSSTPGTEAALSPHRNWQRRLPVLSDGVVTLRALRRTDAASLVVHLNDPRVTQYIAPAPSTVAGFERFIRWTHADRRRGGLACFGIVRAGESCAAGIMQIWPIERDFSTAEWGFALGAALWGTGVFERAATLFLDAVFANLNVYRLEARAVDANTRGNRAFERLGATRDGVLRGGFRESGGVRDHIMWSILAPEWRAHRARVHRAN